MRSVQAADSFHGSMPPMNTAGVSDHGMSKSSAPFWRTRHRSNPAEKRSLCRQISNVRRMLPGMSGHVANRHRSRCSTLFCWSRRNLSASNETNAELSSANRPPQFRRVRDGTISCPATKSGCLLASRSTSGGFVSSRNFIASSPAIGSGTYPIVLGGWSSTLPATPGGPPIVLLCSPLSCDRMVCAAA